MRPIKFEAHKAIDDKLVYGYLVVDKKHFDDAYIITENNMKYLVKLPVNQFTGRLDTNKREIYEGNHIVGAIIHEQEKRIITGNIYWCQQLCMYKCAGLNPKLGYVDIPLHTLNNIRLLDKEEQIQIINNEEQK